MPGREYSTEISVMPTRCFNVLAGLGAGNSSLGAAGVWAERLAIKHRLLKASRLERSNLVFIGAKGGNRRIAKSRQRTSAATSIIMMPASFFSVPSYLPNTAKDSIPSDGNEK
jgi:hypothetical protein